MFVAGHQGASGTINNLQVPQIKSTKKWHFIVLYAMNNNSYRRYNARVGNDIDAILAGHRHFTITGAIINGSISK